MKAFLIIPAYNEARSIGDVITSCRQAGYSQIIVVDDGSQDKTAEKAREQGALVVRHHINRGAGAATQTGLEAAKLLGAEVVVTLDGDGQHQAKDIARLLQGVTSREADLVIGSRFLEKNRIPFLRRVFNLLANVITFLLSGIFLTDSQSGMKAFGKKALANIYVTANGFEFSSEIIREAKYYGLTTKEVPISVLYTPYSLAKGQNFATGLTTVFKLIVRALMR